MSSELDQQIAIILLAISAISLFLWVQVNRVSPLEGSMIASFGRKKKESDAEDSAQVSKTSDKWFWSSLGLAAASLTYLFATR